MTRRPAAVTLALVVAVSAATVPHRWANVTEPHAVVAATVQDEIVALLQATMDAYNRGDFGGYMALYADNPDLLYIYRGRILLGKAAIAADFEEHFFRNVPASGRPRDARLKIEVRRVDALSNDGVLVTVVVSPAEAMAQADLPAGASSLLMRRNGGRWQVVYEHTS